LEALGVVAQGAEFSVRFWGVRGSIPCPGPATAGYGGNTSCIEVRCGERLLIFDAGTGLYQFGKSLVKKSAIEAELFLTHSHYDHVWGWPHFGPGLDPSNSFHIRAGHLGPTHKIKELMMGLLDDPLSPLNTASLRAKISFEDFKIGTSLSLGDGIQLQTGHLNHPNGASGYRVEFGGHSICYLTDHEHTADGPSHDLLRLADRADIVIYDSTYTDEEFPNHVSWGHSTWQEGVRLCDAANARKYVVFHHDPAHDDGFMDQIAVDVEAMRPGSVVAREGLVLRP
jgi:phosphoribosyl 1,2-cyclic phosphodiesterase